MVREPAGSLGSSEELYTTRSETWISLSVISGSSCIARAGASVKPSLVLQDENADAESALKWR